MAHRQEMVVAALTMVRAWFAAGCPRGADGNTASFEDWDRLVRQPLAWLAKSDIIRDHDDLPRLCDVATMFAEAAADAPHKQNLRAVLHAWESVYGLGKRVSARDFTQNANKELDKEQEALSKIIADAVGKRGQQIGQIRRTRLLAQKAHGRARSMGCGLNATAKFAGRPHMY